MPQSEEDKTKQSLCKQGRSFLSDELRHEVVVPSNVESYLERARVTMLINQIPRPLVKFVINRLKQSYDHRISELVRSELPDRSRYIDLAAELNEQRQKRMIFD